MSLRVESESVFVLHTRPYRNTSLLVDFFTQHHGRMTGVARSARGLKSRFKNIFQPFSPLLVNWTGRGDLRNINHAEAKNLPYPLTGNILYCGLYANELLFKLLPHEEPFPILFSQYTELLHRFSQSPCHYEINLRYFEKHLLQELGYGLSFQKEIQYQEPIRADQFYTYRPKEGFYVADGPAQLTFSGQSLIALDQEDLRDPQHILQAKKLMRMAINDILENKSIASRNLF
jgi:DNA repair protein RecO (recombination protein O)